MELSFEWDEAKNFINIKKHRISFEEAKEVWADESSLEFLDENHQADEDRFIRVGHTGALNILFVVFCEKDQGDIIRIISARKATKKEEGSYERRIRFR